MQDKLKNSSLSKVAQVHWNRSDLELFSLKQLFFLFWAVLRCKIKGRKLKIRRDVSDCVRGVNDSNIFYASSICQILPLTHTWMSKSLMTKILFIDAFAQLLISMSLLFIISSFYYRRHFIKHKFISKAIRQGRCRYGS